MVLPSLSLEGCFIFPLDFSMPCFPLNIKGWKSRWWTRSLSTCVGCQVFLADLTSSYKPPLPVWSSQGECKSVHMFLSFSCLLMNHLGSDQEKTKWKSHEVGPKYCWFYKILMPCWTEGTNCVLYLTAAGDFMLNRFFNIVWPSTVKRKTTFCSRLTFRTWFLQINNL